MREKMRVASRSPPGSPFFGNAGLSRRGFLCSIDRSNTGMFPSRPRLPFPWTSAVISVYDRVRSFIAVNSFNQIAGT
jgi:hypothetical protein